MIEGTLLILVQRHRNVVTQLLGAARSGEIKKIVGKAPVNLSLGKVNRGENVCFLCHVNLNENRNIHSETRSLVVLQAFNSMLAVDNFCDLCIKYISFWVFGVLIVRQRQNFLRLVILCAAATDRKHYSRRETSIDCLYVLLDLLHPALIKRALYA